MIANLNLYLITTMLLIWSLPASPRADSLIHRKIVRGGPPLSKPRSLVDSPVSEKSAEINIPPPPPGPKFVVDPACAHPLVNWDFVTNRVTQLITHVLFGPNQQPDPNHQHNNVNHSISFIDFMEQYISGQINVLGHISGINGTKRYLEELPTALLKSTNLTIIGLAQTHAAVSCDVASMVHHISFKKQFIEPDNEAPLATPKQAKWGFQRLLGRLVGNGPAVTTTSAPGEYHSNWSTQDRNSSSIPHILALWSWWRLDRITGKFNEFDLVIYPRDGDHLAPPRTFMVDKICNEFDKSVGGGGRCLLDGSGWTSAEACRRGISAMDGSISAKVTCRYLHLNLLDVPPLPDITESPKNWTATHTAACSELGTQALVCSPSRASWYRGPKAPSSVSKTNESGGQRERRGIRPHHGKAMGSSSDSIPGSQDKRKSGGRKGGSLGSKGHVEL